MIRQMRVAGRGMSRVRGAGLFEYAIILVGVVLLAGGAYKLLGHQLANRGNRAGNVVASDDNGGGKGGGAGNGSGGGKSSAASNTGGGGKSGGGGGGGDSKGGNQSSNRDTGSDTGGPGGGPSKPSGGGSADVSENFAGKRWMGMGLLIAGIAAIVYVLATMRSTKKQADAMGGKDSSSMPRRRSKKA